MTRPAPRSGPTDASKAQPDLPGTAQPKGERPFLKQCRDVRIGSAGAKLVYLVAASHCDSYLPKGHTEGRCWPSLVTLRAGCEMSKTTFLKHWRYLYERGFVGTQQGSGVKVIRTPSAAMRAGRQAPRDMPADAPQRRSGWRVKGEKYRNPVQPEVPESGTQQNTYQSERTSDGSVAPVAHAKGSDALPERGTGTHTAQTRPARPSPSPGATARSARDSDPDGLMRAAGAEVPPVDPNARDRLRDLFGRAAEPPPALPPLSADVHLTGADLDAATARALAAAPVPAAPGAGPRRCACGREAGLTCVCGRGMPDDWMPAPSADWNAGGD